MKAWSILVVLASCGRIGFGPSGGDDAGVAIDDGFKPGTGDTSCIAQLDAGWQHVCVRATDGRVWCWGFGENMELGDGKAQSRAYPARAPGFPADTAAIALGGHHDCAIDSAKRVVCFGANNVAQLGQGTPGLPRPTAVTVALAGPAREISAGDAFTCAGLDDLSIACWGADEHGQVGNNTVATYQAQPVQIASGTSLGLAAGIHHACAFDGVAQVLCWGDNEFGQIGDGTTIDRHVPTMLQVAASGLVAADHTCGYGNGGWGCWGANANGQLGDNTRTDNHSPTGITASMAFATMTAGYHHTCGLTPAGGLWCWGENDRGQIGDSSTVDKLLPVHVLDNVTLVAAGSKFTCALTTTALECWGDNTNGQLGDNTTLPELNPHRTLFSCDLP